MRLCDVLEAGEAEGDSLGRRGEVVVDQSGKRLELLDELLSRLRKWTTMSVSE